MPPLLSWTNLFACLSIGASLYCLYLVKTFDRQVDKDTKLLDESFGPRPDNKFIATDELEASIKFILVLAAASAAAALLLLWR